MDGRILIRFALAAALVSASACNQVTSDFACAVDGDCTLESGADGHCEPNQRCSYADTECASGYRYGDFAGSFSDQCATTDDCAVEVRAGVHDTCVRRGDGSVWCWGDGTQTTTQVDLPAGAVAQIDVAGAGLCARYADGSLNCAVGATTGDLGLSTKDLSIGTSHLCAITDGHVACWGSDSHGELGDGNMTASTTPAAVIAIFDGRQIAAGLETTCAITGSGVWCWGDNSRDQLGQGLVSADYATTPVSVNVSAAPSAVTVGDRFACALTQDGLVRCWGDDTMGQIGQGSTSDTEDSPLQVHDLTGIVEVTAAGSHACARDGNGSVWCWGSNATHESAAAAETKITKPALVVDSAGAALTFLDVDAGASHTCGRTTDGAIMCWGNNADGQIGDGTFATAIYPTPSVVGCR